jgi:hypothetical protein
MTETLSAALKILIVVTSSGQMGLDGEASGAAPHLC